MEEDGKEVGTRYPRKELIFSSLPYAHALTLQVHILKSFFEFHQNICLILTQHILNPFIGFQFQPTVSNCLRHKARCARVIVFLYLFSFPAHNRWLSHISGTRQSVRGLPQPRWSLHRMLKLPRKPLLNWMQVTAKGCKAQWFRKELLLEPTEQNDNTRHINIQGKTLAGQATLCTHYPAPILVSLCYRAKAR